MPVRIVTASEIREMDRIAIDQFGIPGPVLMESAGAAVVDAIVRRYGAVAGKGLTIYCGAGNNGGDGYVIARRLALLGAKPTVALVAPDEKIKGDARVHLDVLRKTGLTSVVPYAEIGGTQPDIVVDALLGTGLNSAPNELYTDAIRAINSNRGIVPIVSVDIPSGIEADTGAMPGEAVYADLTVTFGAPKRAFYLFPGAARIGEIVVSDIGFPWDKIDLAPSAELNDPGWWKFLAQRAQNANKGDAGHVGIIAGSRGMVGALALASRAAQRAGAGLVTALTTESVQQITAIKLDEQMTVPLPEVNGALSAAGFDQILAFSRRASALCIGPGLTTAPGVVDLVSRIVAEIDLPIVLDADGLNALAMRPEVATLRAKNCVAPLILTPHPGEAARLLGTSITEVESNRVEAVRTLALKYSAAALIKGRYTVIAGTDPAVRFNPTGNPGMATGGMGDTLTGILGALLARQQAAHVRSGCAGSLSGRDALLTTCAAVYIHGLAGDMAVQHIGGEIGLTASDVIDQLPAASARLIA